VTNSTGSLGLLASYRFMLTPHSALEANYSFTQNNQKYCIGGDCIPGRTYTSGVGNPYSYRIHSRVQEVTFAYVFGMTFKRYNPFVEVGGGSLIYTPVLDSETKLMNSRGTKGLAGLMGAGLAYELSPSFDVRVEYRGLLTKTPAFGFNDGSPTLKANRYEILSMPTIGVAYHF
jgi:opacity protein-like surface antigen